MKETINIAPVADVGRRGQTRMGTGRQNSKTATHYRKILKLPRLLFKNHKIAVGLHQSISSNSDKLSSRLGANSIISVEFANPQKSG
jgi:hypothetical protein